MSLGSRVLPASDPAAIAEAATALRAGELVGMPTETVYGLAGDATNPEAVARIFAAKGRPRFNPLIVHVASLAAAEDIGAFSDDALKLGARFWPGPLTLVVPSRATSPVAELATAGMATHALRVPSHPTAQALLAAFGRPLVAPSANRSGHVSATTAAHVAEDLAGGVSVILDAGAAPVGVESTIVGLAGQRPTLLRAGAVPRDRIEAVLGRALASASVPPMSGRAKRSSPLGDCRQMPATPPPSSTSASGAMWSKRRPIYSPRCAPSTGALPRSP